MLSVLWSLIVRKSSRLTEVNTLVKSSEIFKKLSSSWECSKLRYSSENLFSCFLYSDWEKC